MKYLALDFEGSGTDPQRHAPVSLGVAYMEDGEVVESKEWLIKPPTHYKDETVITREYDERARMIHGYTLEHLIEHGEPLKTVCGNLETFAKKHGASNMPVCAYNAGYDLPMLGTLLFLAGEYDRRAAQYFPFPTPLSGPWQCVMLLAKRRIVCERWKLDNVAEYFGLSRSTERHCSEEDAILCGKIFHLLRTSPQ